MNFVFVKSLFYFYFIFHSFVVSNQENWIRSEINCLKIYNDRLGSCRRFLYLSIFESFNHLICTSAYNAVESWTMLSISTLNAMNLPKIMCFWGEWGLGSSMTEVTLLHIYHFHHLIWSASPFLFVLNCRFIF